MKKIFISSLLLVIVHTSLTAQVGVLTQNPQGVFHIDAAKDNPATGFPTATQLINDVVVTPTGAVGIGSASPRTKLEVVGAISTVGGTFPDAINLAAIGWDVIQNGIGFNEYVNYRGTGNGGHRFYSLTSGTPTLSNSLSYLDINGAWMATAYNTSSDFRLKRNIKSVENGLETILKLNPVSYEKRINLESKDYNTKEIGFIAQELRKILPDVVKESNDPDKLLSVNYNSLVPVLAKAIQELNTKVDELNAKIQKLETENASLKNGNKQPERF